MAVFEIHECDDPKKYYKINNEQKLDYFREEVYKTLYLMQLHKSFSSNEVHEKCCVYQTRETITKIKQEITRLLKINYMFVYTKYFSELFNFLQLLISFNEK